jgi:serine/threonine-protein kinase ATR
VLLNYVEGMHTEPGTMNRIVPFAVEAAWATGRWDTMQKFRERFDGSVFEDFDVSLACLFENVRRGCLPAAFDDIIRSMREKISASMTFSATTSLSACHDLRLRCHAIADLEILAGVLVPEGEVHDRAVGLLERRLEVLGAFVNDKQYLLGIRRAAMQLMRYVLVRLHDVAS